MPVQNISIGDDPTFSTQRPFIQAQELDVSFKLLPLPKESLLIDSFTLQHPRFEFIKGQRGVWNFASIGTVQQVFHQTSVKLLAVGLRPSLQSSTTRSENQSGEVYFSLRKLKIRDAEIAITDLETGSPRRAYDHIDANLQDVRLDGPFLSTLLPTLQVL